MVQVKDGFGDLVYYVLFVPLLQLSALAVLSDQSMQVDVHVLEY